METASFFLTDQSTMNAIDGIGVLGVFCVLAAAMWDFHTIRIKYTNLYTFTASLAKYVQIPLIMWHTVFAGVTLQVGFISDVDGSA